jgi:hypothetical protein
MKVIRRPWRSSLATFQTERTIYNSHKFKLAFIPLRLLPKSPHLFDDSLLPFKTGNSIGYLL